MSNLGNKETFSKNLKKYMRIFGKDRQDMVEELGFKYTTFNDWYNGNTYPRIDKIEKIANYFGITKADLIEEESDREIGIKFPAVFTDPKEARKYVMSHAIFGSDGLNVSKMDDEEIVEFANELMKQMEMVSYKYRK
jgi:transcriptional regulator with XRE-family HTH domain